ncbi:histidine kinase [Rickettsia endosymbiont of Proechinophthirus fluctus]|nr:histidine kinase [Rickettsia endosymbiont of Proechinophthirus fluctus]
MRCFKSVVQDNIIKFKNLNIDLNTEKVYKDGLNIPLGPTEFKILQLFFRFQMKYFCVKK